MKPSRRAFLASLVAAIAGRSLFRKPKAHVGVDLAAGEDRGISIRVMRRWDHDLDRWTVRMDVIEGFHGPSLFNPRENVHAQWAASRYDFPVFYGGPGGNVDA